MRSCVIRSLDWYSSYNTQLIVRQLGLKVGFLHSNYWLISAALSVTRRALIHLDL